MSDYAQGGFFDLNAGRQARDDGIALITDNRATEVERVKSVILRIGVRQRTFTADSVRAVLDFTPSHPNVIGSAFQSLSACKPPKIVATTVEQSKAKSRHASKLCRWRLA